MGDELADQACNGVPEVMLVKGDDWECRLQALLEVAMLSSKEAGLEASTFWRLGVGAA
jgi:hypothetical protein